MATLREPEPRRGVHMVGSEGGPGGEIPVRIDRFIRVDPLNGDQLRAVLDLFRHEANRDHIASISRGTTTRHLHEYYSEPGREGITAVSRDLGILGVCDLGGGPEAVGGRAYVSFRGEWLNRLAVRPEVHRHGIATQLVTEAERRAFTRRDRDNLMAAVVLDLGQTEEYQQVRNDFRAERRFRERFAREDARGKVFVRNRGWEISGPLGPNVRVESTGRSHQVFMLTKSKEKWNEEQQPAAQETSEEAPPK